MRAFLNVQNYRLFVEKEIFERDQQQEYPEHLFNDVIREVQYDLAAQEAARHEGNNKYTGDFEVHKAGFVVIDDGKNAQVAIKAPMKCLVLIFGSWRKSKQGPVQ